MSKSKFEKLHNQIQWDNEPDIEIVRLSNNKFISHKPKGDPHVLNNDMGASVYLFSLPRETEEITDEEWELIKFYCEMDGDERPEGIYQSYFDMFWYIRLFVA